MGTINENANRVLAEFGGRIPAHLLQFEDARREFLEVRALQLQLLGISDTDKTVTSIALADSQRTGQLGGDLSLGTPAFVEFEYYNQYSNPNVREKVEIVPVEKIPEYEGSSVIAFFGTPLQYRAGFDYWNTGTITVWFDAANDILTEIGEQDANFSLPFTTFLVKQAAHNLVGVLMVNLAFNSAPEEDERMKLIMAALGSLQNNLAMQVEHWRKEFKKYVGTGFNSQTRVRRTWDEIRATNYNNASRANALDFGNY